MRRFNPTPLPLTGAIMSALLSLYGPQALAQTLPAGALPTNGQVVSGTASMSQSGNSLTVNQSSNRLITNWDTFNIGSAARVEFRQPSASSVALNRVLSAEPSRVYGQLSANGQVFLVNPAGILFAPGARVNVGGLVASTLDISNTDFEAGRLRFAGGGQGEVVNEGTIDVAAGGYAALVGPRVRNQGAITSPGGSIALAAAPAVTLDLHGDGLISVELDGAAAAALAANASALRADGGLVLLAARGTDPMATVINNTGTIHATSLASRNGVIRLEGGDAGIVNTSGVLDASGKGAGQTGGTVKVLGDKVGLFADARIDASGDQGGGTILVGGNWQGSGAEQRASATFVGADARMEANATGSGHGGTIVVWSDGTTRFGGELSARGAGAAGHGGQAEVSGKSFLDFTGHADLGAASGPVGTLLLDPTNITISTGANTAVLSGEEFTGSAATAVLNVTTLQNQLANSNVTVSTASAAGSAGDITVANSVAYTGAAARTLTLRADQDVILNSNVAITATSGPLNVVLNAGAGAAGSTGSVSLGSRAQVVTNGGNITIGGGPGASGAATGGASTSNGFRMQGGGTSEATGALLSAGAGNITIQAASSSASGVTLQSTGFSTITTTTGNISINSTGSTNGINLTTGTNTIRSTSGSVTLTGASTGSGSGVNLSGAGTNTIATTSGTVTVNGSSASGTALTLSPSTGTAKVEATGAGNIVLAGDSLAVGASGVQIRSNGGQLTIRPATNTTAMNVGTGASGGLAVGTNALAAIQDGFSVVNLGHSAATGGLQVSDLTLSDALALRQGSGAIALAGNLALGTNGLTVQSTGAITQTAGQVTAGPVSLSGGSASDITLGSTGNDFTGPVSVASARNVTLRDAGALDLGPITAGGNLVVTANGLVSQSGALTLGGGLTVATGHVAGDVTINNAGAAATVLGETQVGNNFALTTGGNVSQASGTALTIGNNFSVTGGSLLAPAAANVIGGADNSAGSSTIIKRVGVVDLSTQDVGAGAGNITTAGNLIVQSLASAPTIGGTVGAGTTAVNLGNAANNIAGPISITSSAPTVLPAGADVATGITQNGANLSVGGSAAFSAAASSANAGGGAGAIVVNGAGNTFGGAVSFNGGDVQLRSAGALTVGPSTATGNLLLQAGGSITQTGTLLVGGNASLALDAAGNVSLANAGNDFQGQVGVGGTSVGNVSLADTNALQIGALDIDGNLVASAGSISTSGALQVAGTSSFTAAANATLTNSGNALGSAVSVNAASASIVNGQALQLGTSNVSGNLSLTAAGPITQSGALTVGGNLALQTTHAAGDVAINNSGAASTSLGSSLVGGDFSVVATGKAISQAGGSAINVAGDFTTTGASSSTDAAANLIGGTDNSLMGGVVVKQVGVVQLGDLNTAGNLTVISLANSQSFASGPTHGAAVTLNNTANNVAGTISVTTTAPAIRAAGAPVATGITQSAGTSVQVGGNANFSAAGGNVTVANAGNTFAGSVSVSGQNVALAAAGPVQLGAVNAAGNLQVNTSGALTQSGAALAVSGTSSFTAGGPVTLAGAANDFSGAVSLVNSSGAVSIADANALSLGTVNAAGALTVSAGGVTTLQGSIEGTGVTFIGSGSGAVALAGDSTVNARTGAVNLGSMAGGSHDLTLVADSIDLAGNWSGTGRYVLQPFTASTSVGIGGSAGTFQLSAAEMARIANGNAEQVTIGRADGTGAVNVSAISFDDALALHGGAMDFAAGTHTYGAGLSAEANGRVRLSGARLTATAGDISISGTGSGSTAGIALSGGSQVRTTSGTGSIALTGTNASGTGVSMGSGTNLVQADGSGHVVVTGISNSATTGFGISIGSGGTNTIRSANGTVTLVGHSGGTQSGISMGSGTNTVQSDSGDVVIRGSALGTGNGISMATGTNVIQAGAAGNVTLDGQSTGQDGGYGVNLGTAASGGTNTIQVAGGVLAITAQSAGTRSALSMGTVQNRVEALAGGSIAISATALGSANAISVGSSGNNAIRTSNGDLAVTGVAHGGGNGISMASGTNLIEAGGSGNASVQGVATNSVEGIGVSMGSGGNNTIRSADGDLTVRAQSAGSESAMSMGSGTNTLEVIGGGSLSVEGASAGSNGVSLAGGGTNTVRATSGALNITGTGGGRFGDGVVLGSGIVAVQTSTGAISISGVANGAANGVLIDTSGTVDVLTATGNITFTGASAGGTALAFRPEGGAAHIQATGAGNISFRADSYDASPTGGGSVRIASGGGVLSIEQLTRGVTIGAGEGAFGTLNWSPAEISQVDGFSLVRIGNSESGALDLRPPWFPFPVERPAPFRTADEQRMAGVLAVVHELAGAEEAPADAGASRLRFRVEGFDDAGKK